MTDDIHPNTRAAERRKKAVERAQRQRERVRIAMLTDAAIVDALGEAFLNARPGVMADALILDVAQGALRRLQEAKVPKPKATFRDRLGYDQKPKESP